MPHSRWPRTTTSRATGRNTCAASRLAPESWSDDLVRSLRQEGDRHHRAARAAPGRWRASRSRSPRAPATPPEASAARPRPSAPITTHARSGPHPEPHQQVLPRLQVDRERVGARPDRHRGRAGHGRGQHRHQARGGQAPREPPRPVGRDQPGQHRHRRVRAEDPQRKARRPQQAAVRDTRGGRSRGGRTAWRGSRTRTRARPSSGSRPPGAGSAAASAPRPRRTGRRRRRRRPRYVTGSGTIWCTRSSTTLAVAQPEASRATASATQRHPRCSAVMPARRRAICMRG